MLDHLKLRLGIWPGLAWTKLKVSKAFLVLLGIAAKELYSTGPWFFSTQGEYFGCLDMAEKSFQ